MSRKTEGDHIRLLLAIIEHADGIKWDEVAVKTGLYKSGKFVKQALNSIKSKYSDNPPDGCDAQDGANRTQKPVKAKDISKKRSADNGVEQQEAVSSKKRKMVLTKNQEDQE